MYIKKFDKLLLTSFFPPLVVTFFIALFVLVMQTLWLYIDDIAGKGVGFFLMVELVAYLSVSMVPMALPVAVLISSVMVLGNLAERYELSSIKSAGVSLWRVMSPLMVATMGIAVLSFFCSNYFIPYSNLKFKSRLYDVRKQKPTLSMEESVFNDDFQGFNIRIGDKKSDNRTITDILLYDDSYENEGRLYSVVADSGIMFGTPDGRYFVMQLFNGNQYMVPKSKVEEGTRDFPLIRSSFKEWTKVFDLTEFNLDRTDENLFKTHHTMMSNHQLGQAIDSINNVIAARYESNSEQTDVYFYFLDKIRRDRNFEKQSQEQAEREAKEREKWVSNEGEGSKDSVSESVGVIDQEPPEPENTSQNVGVDEHAEEYDKGMTYTPPAVVIPTTQVLEDAESADSIVLHPDDPWPQYNGKYTSSFNSFALTFSEERWPDLLEKAKMSSKNVFDQVESTILIINKTREAKVKHVFEYHSKYSMAVACIIFLFIGAPMGAIVRKGGFGWPLLISIGFFMLFVVITIFSKNIAERFVIDAILASWMNCLIVFPMGLVLTFLAMRDTNLQQLLDFFRIKLPGFKRAS